MRYITLVDIKRYINENTLYKFYTSRHWKSKRAEILRRDNYECQECKKQGRVKVQTDKDKLDDKDKLQYLSVHHIDELKRSPHKAFDNDNLTTLCNECHNLIHEKHKLLKKKKNDLNKRFAEREFY